MEKKVARDNVRQPEALVKKMPYKTPSLQVFGGLHRLTQGSNQASDDGAGQGGNNIPGSERRIKESIVRIGTHPLGIGLYLFDYKPEYRDLWGHGRQFGVMADEVETVMPSAVTMHPEGYRMVNHTMLGISRAG